MAHEHELLYAWEFSKAKWVAAEIINRMMETSHPDTARLSESLPLDSTPRKEKICQSSADDWTLY